MQIGDALVGVHHVERRARGHAGVDRRHDFGLVFDASQKIAKSGIRVHAKGGHLIAKLLEHWGKKGFDRVAKDDRVRDLHHRGLEVDGKEHALGLGPRDFFGEEGVQSGGAHIGGVYHRARRIAQPVLEHGLAIGGFQNDLGLGRVRQGCGFLVRKEIPA